MVNGGLIMNIRLRLVLLVSCLIGNAQAGFPDFSGNGSPIEEEAERVLLSFYKGWGEVALEQVRAQANAERDIMLTREKAKADAIKWVGATREVMKSLTNGRNLSKISGSVVVGASGVAAAYFGAKLGFNYLNNKLMQPVLIRETSIRSQKDQIVDAVLGRKVAPSRFAEIVLESDLEFQIKEIADTLEMGIKDGEGVRHILLTGPAGTGKTMFAKALAMRLNQKNLCKNGKRIPVNYICCSGGDFAQFTNGKDIEQMHSIFDYANKAEGITVLFFDEIDSLLQNRAKSSEAAKTRTNTFLSVFDKPTHSKIIVIGATNFENSIDRAAFTRFSKKVAFRLPEGDTLAKLFNQYIKKEVLAKKITLDKTFIDNKQELINNLQGLSPRTIEDVASQMYMRVRFLRKKELTYEIAHSLIQEAQAAETRNKSDIAPAV